MDLCTLSTERLKQMLHTRPAYCTHTHIQHYKSVIMSYKQSDTRMHDAHHTGSYAASGTSSKEDPRQSTPFVCVCVGCAMMQTICGAMRACGAHFCYASQLLCIHIRVFHSMIHIRLQAQTYAYIVQHIVFMYSTYIY